MEIFWLTNTSRFKKYDKKKKDDTHLKDRIYLFGEGAERLSRYLSNSSRFSSSSFSSTFCDELKPVAAVLKEVTDPPVSTPMEVSDLPDLPSGD